MLLQAVHSGSGDCIGVETSKRYADIYVAALKGDWNKAEEIFRKHPEDVRAKLSLDVGDTVLHVAAAGGKIDFLKKLVCKYMAEDDLIKTNEEKNTAFSIAAMSGDTKLAELMMLPRAKTDLAMIRNADKKLPVLVAAYLGHEKMVRYLYTATKDNLTEDDRIELLIALIENDLYDVAIEMVKNFPGLAVSRVKVKEDQNENGKTEEYGETALHALAQKPLRFHDVDKPKQGILQRYYDRLSGTNKMNKGMHPKALELVQLLWNEVVNRLDYCKILKLTEEPRRLIFDAAKEGNVQFLSIIFSKRPDLIIKVNKQNYSIFHTAVFCRHEKIFKLLHKMPSIKNVIVALEVGKEKNNILHLAAKLPPDPNRLKIVSGAALQMQRELWWFKEVRKLMPPHYAEAENCMGKTARTLFTESHEDLMEKGEKWMKTTANSCMIVATLIATIVFAAAFTVPGGIKEDTGTPNFLKKATFTIFAVSDTVSLVSSSCSILTFLSILTARYAERDFLWSLPTKLLLGLFTLFISVLGMMIVFCTTLFMVFHEGTIWPAALAVVLAFFPVITFILQHIRLFSDVVWLMSSSNSLFRENRCSFLLFKGKQ